MFLIRHYVLCRSNTLKDRIVWLIKMRLIIQIGATPDLRAPAPLLAAHQLATQFALYSLLKHITKYNGRTVVHISLSTLGRGWTARGSSSDRAIRFVSPPKRPDKLWGPHSFLFNGLWDDFLGDKVGGS
jgi:hypothetical protein